MKKKSRRWRGSMRVRKEGRKKERKKWETVEEDRSRRKRERERDSFEG